VPTSSLSPMTGATLHSPGSRSTETNPTSAAPNSRSSGRRLENQIGDSDRGFEAPGTPVPTEPYRSGSNLQKEEETGAGRWTGPPHLEQRSGGVVDCYWGERGCVKRRRGCGGRGGEERRVGGFYRAQLGLGLPSPPRPLFSDFFLSFSVWAGFSSATFRLQIFILFIFSGCGDW
jgi:hypothetical protein